MRCCPAMVNESLMGRLTVPGVTTRARGRSPLAASHYPERPRRVVRRCPVGRRVDVKQQDAFVLTEYFSYRDPVRKAAPGEWCLQPTYTWITTLERAPCAARAWNGPAAALYPEQLPLPSMPAATV